MKPSPVIVIDLEFNTLSLWTDHRGALIVRDQLNIHEFTDAEVDALADLVEQAKAARRST